MAFSSVRWQRKLWVLVSLVINLGLLCYFKYANFLGDAFASLVGGTFHHYDIFLPVGISFFTFQSLSYTIDVYRKDITPLTNLLDYAFYVSFFPQLVAGPIVRARDFIPQIRRPLFVSHEMFGRGIFLIASGLFKKAIISDYISVNFVERIFDNPTLYSGVENLMGVYGYALQIYCDFSGYSDMAIGIALLLGFHFNKNFDSPYKSASITEFWRRWHISLSSWLKDYLYISLGGNRKGKIRQYANLIITMFLGGLWHGASWNFVVWGLFHGVALAAHKFWMTLTGRKKGEESHGNRDKCQQEKVSSATFIIKIIGECGNKQQTCSQTALQQQINQYKCCKQPQENAATEYHRRLRVINEYVSQTVKVNIPHNHYRLLKELDKTIHLAIHILPEDNVHGPDASILLPASSDKHAVSLPPLRTYPIRQDRCHQQSDAWFLRQ